MATVVGIAGLGVGGYLAWPHLEASIFKSEVAVTEVTRVSPSQGSTTLTSTGYVVPRVISHVGATTVGRVMTIAVAEGAVVHAGDLLIELDPLDAERAVAQSRSQLLAATARIETARANANEVRIQAERQRGLVQRGVVAESIAADLEARVGALVAATSAAEAEARAARSAVDVARAATERTRILSPIDGTVISRPPDVGTVVYPERDLFQVADMNVLLVETDVPEARLSIVRIGAPAEIVLDAFPGRRFRGEVTEIGRRIDRARATATVKVRFAEPAAEVLADMAARVSFLTEQLTEEQMQSAARTVVPANAVTTRGGQRVVFVIEDRVVRRTPVRLGSQTPEGYELLEGPDPGTKLVANPPSTMDDGQRVEERNR